jgi:hypothetical protein
MFALLFALALLAQPTHASWVIGCADGSACDAIGQRTSTIGPAHACCHPTPCKEHPATLPKSRCVIKAKPPVAYLASRDETSAVAHPALILDVAAPIDATPAYRPYLVADVRTSDPPWRLHANHALGARAPPFIR